MTTTSPSKGRREAGKSTRINPKTTGRVYRTVGVSLSPDHVRWLKQVDKRLGLGPSQYLQGLIGADQRSGGALLAKAFAVDQEAR